MSSASTATTLRTGHSGIPLREQVEEALERLSRLLVAHVGEEAEMRNTRPSSAELLAVQRTVRFLGQLTAAWSSLPADALPATGAGFGSTVVVEDTDQGTRASYTLMAGPVIDIDEDQVSLNSPVGQALLGTLPGDVVTVDTPLRQRRLRVVSVRTLQDRIREEARPRPAA